MKTKLYKFVSDLWDKGLYSELSWIEVADQLYGSYSMLCELELGTFQTHDSMYFLYTVALARHELDLADLAQHNQLMAMNNYWIN